MNPYCLYYIFEKQYLAENESIQELCSKCSDVTVTMNNLKVNSKDSLLVKMLINEIKLTNYSYLESINKKLISKTNASTTKLFASSNISLQQNYLTIGTWVLIDSMATSINNSSLLVLIINGFGFSLKAPAVSSTTHSLFFITAENSYFPSSSDTKSLVNGNNTDLNIITYKTWAYIAVSFKFSSSENQYKFLLSCDTGNDLYGNSAIKFEGREFTNPITGANYYLHVFDSSLRSNSNFPHFFSKEHYFLRLLFIYKKILSINDLFYLKYK